MASAILEKEPEAVSIARPMTPPAMEHLVRTCLAKEPDDRFQSAHDLKLQLQWIAAGGSQVGAPAVVTSRRKKTAVALTAALVAGWALAAAAGVLALINAKRLTSAQQIVRASIEEPAGFEFAGVLPGPPALSPDGQQMAFIAQKKGASEQSAGMIFVRRMGAGGAERLAGTEGGIFPFWSPDGKYLGFFADGKLKKIEASGGPVQVLCDAPDGRGGSWSERGTIVFAPRISGPLEAVSVQRGGNDALGSVYAGSLDGGEPKQILPAGSNVAYSSGYLFYVKESTLMAQAFDPGGLRFEGKPVSVAASVEYYNPRDLGYFSVSHNVLVYRSAAVRNRELVLLDTSGKEVDHWGEPAPYGGGRYSPRSQMTILYRANANGRGNSLWLADLQRKTVLRLTGDSELEQSGVVSADGNSVFIATTSGYNSSLVRRGLIASGKEEKLLDEPRGYLSVMSVSQDGRYGFFSQQDSKTSFDIYYMDLLGDRKLLPLLNSRYSESDARLSPDNKWLAYASDETGTAEVYVTPFPGTGSKWQVSGGGITARGDYGSVMDWSVDGKNLRYQQGDKIYNVEIRDTGGKPEFSAPKEFVSLPANLMVISVLPDGKRVLAARPIGDGSSVPVDFVLNWQHLVR